MEILAQNARGTTNDLEMDIENRNIAERWCEQKGSGWSVRDQLGKGSTAVVFEIASSDGLRTLKLYSPTFSAGEKGAIEQKRIDQQVALKNHSCPSLVQVYEGGTFQGRLYLLMNRASGKELEKVLPGVPRNKIRHIVDQVARAALFLKDKDLCHRDIKAANIFVSDDFSQVTLLDISVIRNVYDPIGVGTDHDGQLPVVATARYSPPEYLFRVLEPSPELWHALSVYQLGALLHDLIMKESLFQSEYLKSQENRYRFAWIVATVTPKIQAHDVDEDLVFTARRALDKDWKRRSGLTLEDFLADSNVQQAHAFQFLGLADERRSAGGNDDVAARLQRVREISSGLQYSFHQFLRKSTVTAKHEEKPGPNDYSKLLTFSWDAPAAEPETNSRKIEFQLPLELRYELGGYCFRVSAKLSTFTNDARREVVMELPGLPDEPGVESLLASQAEAAFGKLALEITRKA